MMFLFADFELHERTRELRRGGVAIGMEPRVFDLLLCLVRNRSRLVSRSELLDSVWGGVVVGDAALSRAVREARRVLGDDGEEQRFIKTAHARGFRFVAPTVERADEDAPAEAPPETAPADDFVGRQDAQQRFATMLADASAGQGATMLVMGEAGIGKTRVLERFAQMATRAGAAVRLARCSEADGVPALWPFEQIIRADLAQHDPASLAPEQRAAVADVATLAPEEARRLGIEPAASPDGAEGRFRLFAGITRYLTLASPRRPRVIVIDDLHLADAASLALVRELAPHTRGAPVVLVAAMRDMAGEVPPPLARAADALARRTPRSTLRLEGLNAEEVERLVRAHTTADLSPAAIESLRERTGGNPLFLSHLLAFVDGDADVRGPDSVRMPAALREAIDRTLDTLSSECVRTLSLAAVIGPRFSVAVLAAAAGERADALLDSVGEAVEYGVLRRVRASVDGYEFLHALLRDGLYERIGLGERARLHACVGDAMLRLHPAAPDEQAEELAHHFVRASSAGRTAEAVEYATLAADRAVARAAYEHAAGLYCAALEVLTFAPDPGRRAQLLVRLGSALGRDGRLAEAGAAFRGAASFAGEAPAEGSPPELDVQALRESFHRILERTPTATTRFYEILFDRHPEARPLFRRNSAPVQAKMMSDTLMAIIDRLEDAPWLKASLAALGVRHVEYGIREPMYAWVGGSLLAALAEAAGELWTPRVARAWADAYAAISRMMIDGARIFEARGVG